MIPDNPTPADQDRAVQLSMLNTVNCGLTAQIGLLLSVPVPADLLMNMLIEHVCKLLALVEPEQLRNSILAEIRKNLPGVLNRHVEERMRTPGGILVPPGAAAGRPN